RAPSEWLFGYAEHYFVTDAQKSEVLPIMMTAPRWVLGLGLLWLLMCGAVAAAIAWALAGVAFDAAIAVVQVLAVAPFGLIPAIGVRLTWRRLKPILAGLPRTDEQGRRIQ